MCSGLAVRLLVGVSASKFMRLGLHSWFGPVSGCCIPPRRQREQLSKLGVCHPHEKLPLLHFSKGSLKNEEIHITCYVQVCCETLSTYKKTSKDMWKAGLKSIIYSDVKVFNPSRFFFIIYIFQEFYEDPVYARISKCLAPK